MDIQCNPYQTLQLSTRASVREVIQRSKQLSRETMDRDKQAEYRRAAEEIHQHPVRRACNQFWEPPDTCYLDEAIESFCARFERPPVNRRSLAQRKKRFLEKDCCAEGLAYLAVPPPEPVEAFTLHKLPQPDLELPWEPWELLP
jgi:hypothetical protein